MTGTNPATSINTLNVKGLNAPIKRQRLTDWIKKQELTICCPQETHFKYKDTHKLKVNRERYHAETNQKKAGIAILISDRAHYRPKNVIRDKEG